MNPTPYDQVLEFHQTFRLLPPPPNFEAVRRKMIKDEAEEILTADTPAKLHDWICDMIYFVMGGYVELGNTTDHAPYWSHEGARPYPSPTNRTNWLKDIQFIMNDEAATLGSILREIQISIEFIAGYAGYPMADFKKDFAKVHAANMRKVWTDEDVADVFMHKNRSADWDGKLFTHTNALGTWTADPIEPDRWIVKFLGKIQKPPGWSLEGEVEK